MVTGGAGFIGSHIVDLLIVNEFDVAVVDDFSTGKRFHVNPSARVYECDIRLPELNSIVYREQPECIVHHAAHIDVRRSVSDPTLDGDVNIIGSVNLLECARRNGVRKIVYASTAAVYGNPLYLPIDEEHSIRPTSPYGLSKYTVEKYLDIYSELYGLKYTVLRYSNVYGPRQDPLGEGGVVAIFANRILSRQHCTIYGDGEQTRDFVYVEDVARANLLAIDHGDNAVINVSCQTETSINDLVNRMKELTGREVRVTYAPERPGEIRRSVLKNERARELLGWTPVHDVSSGVKKLFEHETARVRQ